ncbi:MAG: hypothetical protein IJZ29_00030 [Clostridia bacterium]|nr:hypothetical protein [Clostridia bacterium]
MENTNAKDVYYEIYIKDKPAIEIIDRVKLFDIYDFSKKFTSTRTITYYDTPDNRLQLAKIILSTDVENNNGEIVLEKNIDGDPNEKYIRLFDIYKLSMPIVKDSLPQDNIAFLRESLPRLFQTPLNTDPEFVFRKVVPKYKVYIQNEHYKIVNVNGFKVIITVENTTFHNLTNNRKNYVTFVRLREAEDSLSHELDDFIVRLEKYCKFILRITESKYNQCVRMTRDLPKPDKKKRK